MTKKKLFSRHNKQLILSIAIFTGLVVATIFVILYGKGYRFGFQESGIELKGTGLLVAKSVPEGAQVFVDGKLKTATDTTINMPPGEYDLKIVKEGYFPWEKKVVIHAEIVTLVDALLIPIAPKLESITDLGAQNPTIDPTLTKIAFTVSSGSAERNGIYVFDMGSNRILALQGSSTQIIDDSFDEFSKADISWSPDGKDIIATISGTFSDTTYLLDTDRSNQPPNNVSDSLAEIDESWQEIADARERSIRNSLPRKVRDLADGNFNILSISPNQEKILYTASRSATLPPAIEPKLIGVNSTAETRDIVEGEIYIYDVAEDRNYEMEEENFEETVSWLNTSRHIMFVRDNALHFMDFDGLNDTVVYAGPFEHEFIFPWPDSTRIVILTNLGNTNTLPNLYTIILR
ncbi:MAG: hypothetical protein A3A51_04440 [Candidatus Levybacteria bacterium RIFCSPLOWO2_01_FULL_39_10]|nr:MAG: hypothetical protein A3A51_04440 [Candidatus Levybacteria bacterium RIFCSPLOWO2_01_FULL_39_10]